MLTILIGKSGSGKDTILNLLCKSGYWNRLVTTTSRPKRCGEKDGIDYNFISKEEFLDKISKNQFLEYRSYNTLVEGKPDVWYYGTSKFQLDEDKNYAIIVDLQGAEKLINHYGKENCFVVSIEVPDDVRKQRAIERGDYDKIEWERRLKDDNEKFNKDIVSKIANFHCINTNDIIDVVVDLKTHYDIYKLLRMWAKCTDGGNISKYDL